MEGVAAGERQCFWVTYPMNDMADCTSCWCRRRSRNGHFTITEEPVPVGNQKCLFSKRGFSVNRVATNRGIFSNNIEDLWPGTSTFLYYNRNCL